MMVLYVHQGTSLEFLKRKIPMSCVETCYDNGLDYVAFLEARQSEGYTTVTAGYNDDQNMKLQFFEVCGHPDGRRHAVMKAKIYDEMSMRSYRTLPYGLYFRTEADLTEYGRNIGLRFREEVRIEDAIKRHTLAKLPA